MAKTVQRNRLNKAIEILNHAINNSMSMSEASIAFSFSNTYLKNVKSDIRQLPCDDEEAKTEFIALMDVYESSRNSGMLKKGKSDFSPVKTPSNNNPSSNTNATNGVIYQEDGDKATIEINTNGENGENSIYPKNHIRTLDDLLIECGVDTQTWRVSKHLVNKWDVTSWKSGQAVTAQNFQVKAWLDRKEEAYVAKTMAEIFKEHLNDITTNARKEHVPFTELDNNSNNLFEIGIYDAHVGKLAWHEESGENYDVKIAVKRFMNTIEKLTDDALKFGFGRILLVLGHDFFNADNLNNTTTGGTPQSEDLRWKNTFRLGSKLCIDAINYLKQFNVKIDVVMIPGNHDFERNFYLGDFLDAWFNGDEQVSIDNTAMPRKYYMFGNTLLGLTHGSEEKNSGYPMLMASEQPTLWSQTLFHEWHLGHLHHKKQIKYKVGVAKQQKEEITQEDIGVVVRYLSSISGTDEWHYRKGYTSCAKAGEAFIWCKDSGLKAHLNYNHIS